jgi:PTS system mannose-specific IIC component
MSFMNLLPFILLGAVAGLDVVSFPQAMISRPLVSATVAGALAGDAARGLLIGVVLEMVAIGTLPFGASRYPDWGSASVVGGALYAAGVSGTVAPPGQLALSVLATLVTAWLSGESMVVLRKLNAVWSRHAQPELDSGSRHAVMTLQLKGMSADLVRGGAVTAVCLAVLSPVCAALGARWTSGAIGGAATERAVIAGLTAALGAATVWTLVRGTSHTRVLIAVGLAVGVVWAL